MPKNNFAERQLRSMGWNPSKITSEGNSAYTKPLTIDHSRAGRSETARKGLGAPTAKSQNVANCWENMLEDTLIGMNKTEKIKKKSSTTPSASASPANSPALKPAKAHRILVELPEPKRKDRHEFKLRRAEAAERHEVETEHEGRDTKKTSLAESLRQSYESTRKKYKTN